MLSKPKVRQRRSRTQTPLPKISTSELLDIMRPGNPSSGLELDLDLLDDAGFSDMDVGPTVFDKFPHFPVYPLIYDSIRPAHHRGGTKAETQGPPLSSLKTRIIPVQVEHVSAKNIPCKNSVKKGGERVFPRSLIPVYHDDNDDNNDLGAEADLIESPLAERIWRLQEGEHSRSLFSNKIPVTLMRGESSKFDDYIPENKEKVTIDLTETPTAVNDKYQTRGQTDTSQAKESRKWTVIPIQNIYTKPTASFETSPVSLSVTKPVLENALQKTSQEKNLIAPNLVQNKLSLQDIQSSRATDVSTLTTKHGSDLEIDSNPTFPGILSGRASHQPKVFDVVEGDSSFAEQEVNPVPSYPVYDELKKRLSKENRKIDYIKGDGNCFFRALSKELYGTEKYHKAVRNIIVDIMASNKSSFSQFIDGENVQTHLDRMSEENTWATTCEIYAAATLLQREVYMLTPDPSSDTSYSWLLFQPLFNKTGLKSGSGNKNSKGGNVETVSGVQNKESAGCAATNITGLSEHTCCVTLCNTNGNHYDRIVPDHGGCNCFLPCPCLDGQCFSVDLT